MSAQEEEMTVYCLFEQSGTFKKELRKLGIPAYDYDIENNFEQTDCQTDLFAEIDKAYLGEVSIFDAIKPSDLILAFFPCTYFTDQSQLMSRGDSMYMQKWDMEQRLQYSIGVASKREHFYITLCKLCIVVLQRGLRMIVENPYGKCNFLGLYFPIKPSLIHLNRKIYGDNFRKPTQYFFINCERKFVLEQECPNSVSKSNPVEGKHRFERSVITPEYAQLFIQNYILPL